MRTKQEIHDQRAIIMTDAVNIANETGLTPREILQQRDELLEAVVSLMEVKSKIEADVEFCREGRYEDEYGYIFDEIERAIEKAT